MSRGMDRDKPRRSGPLPADAFTTDWLRKQQLPAQYEREQQQAGHEPGDLTEETTNEPGRPHTQ